MNEHIQVRHLAVTQIRVPLLQPAALYRQQVDSGGSEAVDNVVPLLKLDNALGQKLVCPILPLFPDRVLAVGKQRGKATVYQCLDSVAS